MVLFAVLTEERSVHTKLFVGFEEACRPSSLVPVFRLLQSGFREMMCVLVCVVRHSPQNVSRLFTTVANRVMPEANSG